MNTLNIQMSGLTILVNNLRRTARIGEAIITTHHQLTKSNNRYNRRTIESVHKVQEERIDRLEKNMEDLLKDRKTEDLNEYRTGY